MTRSASRLAAVKGAVGATEEEPEGEGPPDDAAVLGAGRAVRPSLSGCPSSVP